MHRIRVIPPAGLLVFAQLWANPAPCATNNRYVEDFSTAVFKDVAGSTAWWDTASAELKLHPRQPTLLWQLPSGNESLGIAVEGNYVYLADHGAGFKVIDRTSMSVVASLPVLDQTRGLTVQGDYAYVAVRTEGVHIYDISDPTAPFLVASFDTPGDARYVEAVGNYIYIAESNGLIVYDITDPTSPDSITLSPTAGQVRYLDIDGDMAFLADDRKGLVTVDISDPTNPVRLYQYKTPGVGNSVFVDGDLAYFADGSNGLIIFDISDPTLPVPLGGFDTTRLFDVVADGTVAYLADESDGLLIVDVSDPTAPTLIADMPTPGDGLALRLHGDHLYFGDGFDGLKVFDVRDIRIPAVTRSTTTLPGPAVSLVEQGLVVFAIGGFGLQALDSSNPESPTVLSTLPLPSLPTDLGLAGDVAYVTLLDSGLVAVDISDPAQMTLTDLCATPGGAGSVALSGNLAFVTDPDSGLQVVDVTDPANMTWVGAHATTSRARHVGVAGNVAYVAANQPGALFVFDVSDPASPQEIGMVSLGAVAASRLVIDGDRLYVLETNGESYSVSAYDIIDPSTPSLIGSIGLPSSMIDVVRCGDFLIGVGDDLLTIDITDPASMSVLSSSPLTAGSSLTLSGDYAFVANGATLATMEVFEQSYFIEDNVAASLDVNPMADDPVKVRMTTTQTDLVTWEVSGDGGMGWQPIEPGEPWIPVTGAGGDLRWRSTAEEALNGSNPTVFGVELEWLFEFPFIEAVSDVPADQGGAVTITFTRSGYDFASEATFPVTTYKVWRRADTSFSFSNTQLPAGFPFVSYGGEMTRGSAGNGFPPGTWEEVASVSPSQQDQYDLYAPTAGDSSSSGVSYSVFVVSAHTADPSTFFVSAPDSGYSINNVAGAQWAVNPGDLFQDNFAEDGTITGFVRMDNAYKKYNGNDGDDVVVRLLAPSRADEHVPGDSLSGPAVYCHVRDLSAGKSGAVLSGDPQSWPVVGEEDGWTTIQFSEALACSAYIEYRVDLNDSLFTPGDTVLYYFSARDTFGVTNYWSLHSGVTSIESDVRNQPSEATCLPANALSGSTDILYVDVDGMDAQAFFDSAFNSLGLVPDRFDVTAPTDTNAVGPGARVKDVAQQLIGSYKWIIWNTGDLVSNTLRGAEADSSAPNSDFTMLYTFLDEHPDGGGVYISGGNVAEEWALRTDSVALGLRNYMSFNVPWGDHIGAGEPSTPLVVGRPGSPFEHSSTPDVMIAGPDSSVTSYDVLEPAGAALLAMAYSDNTAHGAVLTQTTANSFGDTTRVVLSGFSYHSIRDDVAQVPNDRVEHLLDILRFLEGDEPTVTGIPELDRASDELQQNFPNPFNPVTTIRYRIGSRGMVSLRIYNVAGQLVRTLVDREQVPSAGDYSVRWDGTNDRGTPVATGVYFYRLATPHFSQTRKMLLVK